MQDQMGEFGAASGTYNPYANDGPQMKPQKGAGGMPNAPPGLENFTPEQIQEMYTALETG